MGDYYSHLRPGIRTVLTLTLLLLWVAMAVAEDRVVLTRAKGGLGRVARQTNAPAQVFISGDQFKVIQADVEEVIRLLGEKTTWTDFGPDAKHSCAEIFYRDKRYVLNSWYPLYRDRPTIAVSERRGLVVVSGAAEKEGIERSNSPRYQALVGFFEKAGKAARAEVGKP